MYDIRWIMRAPSRGRGNSESHVSLNRGQLAPRPAKAVKPLPFLGPQGVPLYRWGTSRRVSEEFHRCYCQTANAASAAIASDGAANAQAATANAVTSAPRTLLLLHTSVVMYENTCTCTYIYTPKKYFRVARCTPGAVGILHKQCTIAKMHINLTNGTRGHFG